MALNPNAQKLVDALRSGEYNQGKYALRVHNNFCCLGVACDLFAKETGKGTWKPRNGDGFHTFDINETGPTRSLPEEVRKWLGFTDAVGRFRHYVGVITSLSNMNDHSMTFAEIADLIESEPAGLFV